MADPCPECGNTNTHKRDCVMKLLGRAKRLVEDPKFYKQFLTLRIAAHMVKLDEMAAAGNVPAMKSFREGALDVLELIHAAEEKEAGRAGAGVPREGDGADRPEEPEDPPA